MTWETTRKTYEDNSVIHSEQATRWGSDKSALLMRDGKQYVVKDSNVFNKLKEISTRIDEIDEQLGNNPPDDVKQLLTNFRQYLVEIDSDFFAIGLRMNYNLNDAVKTLYISNYNMINQLVNQVQELHKKLEMNDKAPVVGSAYKYAMSLKKRSGGRTRINKKQKINRKSRKNPKRRLRE
jgi:uncharacterized protein YpuA (DUF1002 family)